MNTPHFRRCLRRYGLLALGASITAATASHAQLIFPKGRARVVGTVLDSAGNPIMRTQICRVMDVNPPYGKGMRCANPDTTGRYVLDSLPGSSEKTTITCQSPSFSKLLARDTVPLVDGEERRLDVQASPTDCDMGPFVVRHAVFEGDYTAGFEHSDFRSCDGTVAASATFMPGVSQTVKWPRAKGRYYSTHFVRWRGTLRGPWGFGHGKPAGYEITVDSILLVRLPGKRDCEQSK